MGMNFSSNTHFVESISVKDFYQSFADDLKLELVAGEQGMKNVIRERSLNRPALTMIGFFKYFAAKRIQLLGAGEMAYLREQSDEMKKILLELFKRKLPCMIISRSLAPSKILKQMANEYNTPLIRSSLKSKVLTTEATLLLEDKFAPRTQLHGTLMDIKESEPLYVEKVGWVKVSVP